MSLLGYQKWKRFQSTLPARGSDEYAHERKYAILEFQSTLPARGSDEAKRKEKIQRLISIHAPRKGERHIFCIIVLTYASISIHAPRKGERL